MLHPCRFGGATVGNRMKRHSVLVVDDDASVRSLYVDALREAGHRVAIAVDGADALSRLRDGSHPCVVLTDVRMPRMDGFELSRAAGSPDALPPTLGELVKRRLDSAQAGRSAIELLAVLGPLSVHDFSDPAALDAAVYDGLLTEQDGEVRFVHPLLAAGAYQRIPPARRRDLHRLAASTATSLEQRARHLALATTRPDLR